jgi:CheY-like chemotaxis protein
VAALDHGADDYVTKPFGTHELLVRCARRYAPGARMASPAGGSDHWRSPHRRPRARHVHLAGAEIRLSHREFAIFRLLAQHAGRIVTHPQLLREVWGPAYEKETPYLRIYIGHLAPQARRRSRRDLCGGRRMTPRVILGPVFGRMQTPLPLYGAITVKLIFNRFHLLVRPADDHLLVPT